MQSGGAYPYTLTPLYPYNLIPSHLTLPGHAPSLSLPHENLMVCLGNICRSPLAEGILQKKAAAAGLDWTIESAGTNGIHAGQSPHP